MSPLEQLRADQHNDEVPPSDAAFAAYLAEIPTRRAYLDRTPTTDVELRHLARIRSAA